jgi:hypothetical protein
VAVYLNITLVLPQEETNCSIFAMSSLKLEKLPRRIARCVISHTQRSTWLTLHFGILVSAVVVDHQMQIERLGHLLVDPSQKAEELLL